MNKETAGAAIRQARITKGYTQRQLAERLYVSNKAVSRWETGKSFPDVGLLADLCETLDLQVAALVGGPAQTPENRAAPTVLSQVLCEAKQQRGKMKQRLAAALTGIIVSVVALIVGGFALMGGIFQILSTAASLEDATLTIAWGVFAFFIVGVRVVLPILAVCIAGRVLLGHAGRIGKLIAGLAGSAALLWLLVFCVQIFLSSHGH